jgi:hypothetical protein
MLTKQREFDRGTVPAARSVFASGARRRRIAACVASAAQFRQMLAEGVVMPPDNRPSPAQAMDLNMLVLQPGRERTEDEFRGIFRTAGFRLERVIPSPSLFSVVESTRV